MKNLIKSILILSVFTFIATSCSEEEKVFAKPVIKNLEVGGHHGEDHAKEGDDKHEGNVGHIGEDLHIKADIVAEGKISYIEIEIHNDKTGVDVLKKKFTEGLAGKINAEFHKHVDIPTKTKEGKTIAEGDYHFHIKVVDQKGQSNEVEKDIKLENEAK